MAARTVLVEEPRAAGQRIVAQQIDGALLGNQPRSESLPSGSISRRLISSIGALGVVLGVFAGCEELVARPSSFFSSFQAQLGAQRQA